MTPSAREPSRHDFDMVVFQSNISAHEYLSHLVKYLRNVTIRTSRPRSSDLLSLDKCAGITWLIIVPLIYFAAIGLILAFLLSLFWYIDGKGVASPTQSEASVVSVTGNSVVHDTVVVTNPVNQSIRHSVVLNYLMHTTEFHASFKTSKTSTRSLEALTDKDLQTQNILRDSIKSRNLLSDSRRLSKSVHDCLDINNGTLDGNSFQRSSKSQVSDSSGQSFASDLKLSELTEERDRNSASFSTDSLESKDCLRASMASHKNASTIGGMIGPEDLYGNGRATRETSFSCGFNDIIKNYTTDKRTLFSNSVSNNASNSVSNSFSNGNPDAFFRDTDEHLRRTYEAALKMDRTRNSNETFKEIAIPCNSAANYCTIPRIPANSSHIYSTTTFCDAYEQNYFNRHSENDRSQIQIQQRRNASSSKTETSLHMSPFSTELSPETSFGVDSQKSDFGESPSSRKLKFRNVNYKRGNYSLNDYQNEGNHSLPEMDCADLNISSVSQVNASSQGTLDHTQESVGSSPYGREDGSQYSASNSLPSSIARYHASKVGYYPSPSAGYPFHCDEDSAWEKTIQSDETEAELQQDGSHSNQTDGSSQCANYGSSSQSSSSVNPTLLLQENSLDPSQQDSDCCHDNSNTIPEFVKLSKRPSPLSSFVNNLRQRCSFDESFLKIKRSPSAEEEALLSPSLTKHTFGNKRRCHSKRRGKVSAEQRLEEFGFLKNNGRNKYVIDPAPGKFETGSGYFNNVYVNNENITGRFRCNLDSENKQFLTPELQICNKEKYQQAKLVFSDKCRSKPTIAQHIERASHLHEENDQMSHFKCQMPIPVYQHEEDIWEGSFSGNTQAKRQVFEVHNEPSPTFREMRSGYNKSKREKDTTNGNVISLSSCGSPPQISQHETTVTNYSERKLPEKLLKGRQTKFFEHKEKAGSETPFHLLEHKEKPTPDTPSHFSENKEKPAPNTSFHSSEHKEKPASDTPFHLPEHKEKLTYDTLIRFDVLNQTRCSIIEHGIRNTCPKTDSRKLTDVYYTDRLGTPPVTRTMDCPMKSLNSLTQKGNRLKRQPTSRALVLPQQSDL